MSSPGNSPATGHQRLVAAMIMTVLAASQLIIAIDYNIVYVALPSIGSDLGFDSMSLQWVVSGYALTFGGFLLLGGRASDLLSRRRLFIIALFIYAAASLAGGLAQSQMLLVASRMFQGFGGAILFPATLAIINTTFAEGAPRNRAVAIWGAAGASGGALGALLGGLLTSGLGWRWTFFVNVPVAIIVAVLALKFLPAAAPTTDTQTTPIPLTRGWRDYDIPGAVTVTLAALLLVYGLVNGPQAGWASITTLLSFIGAAVFLTVFILIESRAATPLMPFRMFRNRSLRTSAAIAALFAGSFSGQFYLLTTWFQDVHGFTAIQAGLGFIPIALAVVAGTNIGSRIVNRFGVRTALAIGLGAGLVGLVLIGTHIQVGGSYATDVLPWIVLDGLGQGITWTAMWIAASTGIRSREQGIASGITSTSQQVGGATGLALLVVITSQASGIRTVTKELENEGLSHAFIFAGVLAGVGVVVSLIGLRSGPKTTNTSPLTPITAPQVAEKN